MQNLDPHESGACFGCQRPHLGGNQQELLSELVANGDWCLVGERICGSTYGGKSKHERIIRSLEKRKLVLVRPASESQGHIEAKASPGAKDALQ